VPYFTGIQGPFLRVLARDRQSLGA